MALKKIITVAFIVCVATMCRKDQNPVPQVSVNFWINGIDSDPQYVALTAAFNAVTVTGGYKSNGILIYRLKVSNDIDDFVAYDKTCPYEVSTCVMNWSAKDQFYCTCGCCKSKYDLVDGYLVNGPAKFPPRKYSCDYSNGNLHIY